MKHKNEFHMNIGGASIILLLIVFALTIFAALSVRASYHELKLAEETRRSVEAYYKADSMAEEIKDGIIVSFGQHTAGGGALETFKYEGVSFADGVAKYSVKAGDEKTLNVKLLLSRDGTVKVNEWRLAEYSHGNYDNGGALFDDTIEILD